MSCMQITAYGPHVKVRNISPSSRCLPSSQLCFSPTYPMTSLRVDSNLSRYHRCNPMCLFGDKGKTENGDEASPWKSLEQAMQGIRKERSVQDVLRDQIQKRDFKEDYGGNFGSPPGGGSGGDGSSGGSEDEGMAGVLDELVQVILATLGFIFLYFYILTGEELTRLAKDYIKYLFTKRKSVRLKRAMYQWKMFYRHITRKEEVQKDWLERAIINTPTWWHNPTKLKRALGAHLSSGD